MSTETLTKCSCDRCGAVTYTEPDDWPPHGWGTISVKLPQMEFSVQDLCGPCSQSLSGWWTQGTKVYVIALKDEESNESL